MDDSKVHTIPLTQGYFALVDADDYEQQSRHKWQVNKNGNNCYAVRTEKKRDIKMHREILNAPPDMHCDHKNHNGLDNRRCNLRLCTPRQNSFNRNPLPNRTSKYKGVHWDYEQKKWRAKITCDKQEIHIGYFDYELDAAIAYDDYAIELFGEFAYLNCAYRPEIQQWLAQTRLFEFANAEIINVMQPEKS